MHLDSTINWHHDANMRTTVTLDKDVEQLLRDGAHRSRTSLKKMINAAIRAGLAGKPAKKRRAPYVVKARPMGMRAGLDPAGFNKLVDDLEAQGYVARSPDEPDGRARLICLTARGEAAMLIARTVVRNLEAEWSEHLGRERMDCLLDALRDLTTLRVWLAGKS